MQKDVIYSLDPPLWMEWRVQDALFCQIFKCSFWSTPIRAPFHILGSFEVRVPFLILDRQRQHGVLRIVNISTEIPKIGRFFCLLRLPLTKCEFHELLLEVNQNFSFWMEIPPKNDFPIIYSNCSYLSCTPNCALRRFFPLREHNFDQNKIGAVISRKNIKPLPIWFVADTIGFELWEIRKINWALLLTGPLRCLKIL